MLADGNVRPCLPSLQLSPYTHFTREGFLKTVKMHEAKTHLSKLVAAAVAGEPFVIAKAGKPLVR